MQLAPGETIDDRYRLLTELGEGAHGVVFSAEDLRTRELVAVKFLNRSSEELVQRLAREAMAAAQLRGTHAVHVHGLRRTRSGTHYLVMELLHGQDFDQLLGALERRGARLSPRHLLLILRPIVDTLEVAHCQGIIHRDLKPSNIFIIDREHGGGIRLLDFGLAKVMNAVKLTAAGMVAGTPSYIAPEVWAGNLNSVDGRSDVYAFGVIVFRALTGKMPTSLRHPMELMKWAKNGKRPSLHAERPDLPASIDAWLEKALAAEPDQRYETMRSVWVALEELIGERARASL
ncbi:MAG TPA: serine/threonine-protein kinase [Polyangiaceae bacterium]